MRKSASTVFWKSRFESDDFRTNERPKSQDRDCRLNNPISRIRSDKSHLVKLCLVISQGLLCVVLRCQLRGKNFNLRALVSFVEWWT